MFLLTFLFGYLNPTSLNTQFTITSTKSSLTISGLSYLQFCEFLEPLQPSCPPTRMLASGGQELLSTVFTDLSLSHKTGPGHDWCSTQFSHSVVSDSLWPHGLQHARPSCPSPTHRVYPNSCPLSQWCHPPVSSSVVPFSSSLHSFPASGAFQMSHITWPKYWSFSFNISPSNEYSGLISFSMNWLDLLAVQGTLKSLLQHHSSKASILWCSAFFIVQLSHPYMTTGKTIALTRRTFVGKVMSLLLICYLGWS